ncbi:cellulose biosynthesis protein BcsE [Serratia sp. UGAL515B_01]|uniref:cellulose biosynthesis protein BcsE n=1 Tax=Serratia sp. UGAL515B_01 TaxID=2986763 RepID=UPI0029547B48|nr:cellulose biosynthesis protein BcsE [Serratia sp. UGAL515B_01]WON77078.1 cellulose biosynthesis protein BcsE [Serratia sp. UGAL515B_01]
MALSFSLGIRRIWHELSVMQAPGFYWVNFDRQADAAMLCKQIIAAQTEDSQLALIYMGDQPDLLLNNSFSPALKKFPLFSLPEKKTALLGLTDDLMRALKPQNRLLILLAPASLWKTFNSDELCVWASNIAKWLHQRQSTLVILCHGSGVNRLKGQLSTEHRTLDGLASMQWQQDSAKYLVNWWLTANDINANQLFTLHLDAQGWQGVDSINTPSPIAEHNDENLYLAEQHILEGAPPLSANWQLFENNTQLMQKGMLTKTATLIFSLHQNDEIDELAHQIHTLRRSRGEGLKIIVRDMSASVRYSDERLLLACGANLIVPHVAPLSRFLTMLEGIQGQRLSRHIPEDISTLMVGLRPLQSKGYLPLADFCSTVVSLMENTLLPEDGKGVMVALRPAPGLSARQSMTLCHQRRFGDIMTVAQNRLFLFLSTCRINDLDTALKFIFRLPVSEAFSNRIVWHQDVDITAKIRLLTQDIESSHRETSLEPRPVKTVTKVAEMLIERHEPVPFTLLSHEHEELE